MNKNSLNDIIPPTDLPPRKSIRDIPITKKKPNKIDELLEETADFRAAHSHTKHEPVEKVEEEEEEKVPPPPRTPRKLTTSSATSPRKAMWWIASVAILILVGASLLLFRKASVAITLDIQSVPVDITATSSAESVTGSSTLVYKVVPIQKEGTQEVNSTGSSKQVNSKSSGTIIIYNNYSADPQQLVATTRFESAAGLTYRIDKAVTVPGTTLTGGKTVPGSVEAVVYADVAGDKYNSDKTDFTIPGLKGGPKYEGFYARSKTTLSGGFSGMMSQVSDTDLKEANNTLQKSLTDQALSDVASQLPSHYVFFKNGGVKTTYTSTVTPGTAGKATVKGTLTAEALAFDEGVLNNTLADSLGKRYNFDNLSDLTLSYSSASSSNNISFISNPVLVIKFNGTLTAGNSFNADNLKRTLAGKSKDQLTEILKLYPEITSADAVQHPFWSSSFPSNPDKITVTVTK